VDEDVGAGLEGSAALTLTFGMYADRQLMTVCGANDRSQRCIVEQRAAAVQYDLDQVVPMRGALVHGAYAVGRTCQFTYRLRWRPGPIGWVAAYGGQERSGDLHDAARRWIDLPAARDARHPAEIVHLDHGSCCQRGGIHQTQVNMSVDDAGHDRAGKLRDSSPPRSLASQGDRPQLMINQLDDCRSESMADPEIVNGKPHDHVPILVRTA
jgi:hypothetical protein